MTFKAPGEVLGDVDAETVASWLAAATDLALVLDAKGMVLDTTFGSDELAGLIGRAWVGQRWLDTVTVESRPKVEGLLAGAAAGEPPRWRHVNHPAAAGPDVPILYAAVPLRHRRHVLVLGRDLRPMAELQQRLVDVQQAMERDYARLRHVETRYRLLFQTTAEAVVIVDAASQRVVEANPAAAELLGSPERKLVGRLFPDRFDVEGAIAVRALLAGVRATGRADGAAARLLPGERTLMVTASLFREGNDTLFAIRLAPVAGQGPATLPPAQARLLRLIEAAPDAFVVTDAAGQVLAVNAAFLDLAQLAREDQALGQSLERWLGRPGVDLSVLIANLRQHGSVKLFATTLRGEYGAVAEVELSASMLPGGEEAAFGFAIRNIGRRPLADGRARRELPRSVAQLTELVGRVPLKDLVRETTDVIERMCIEAALELTGDNRASAAEILGLSRQSLYVKLRRYGLGDLSGSADE